MGVCASACVYVRLIFIFDTLAVQSYAYSDANSTEFHGTYSQILFICFFIGFIPHYTYLDALGK